MHEWRHKSKPVHEGDVCIIHKNEQNKVSFQTQQKSQFPRMQLGSYFTNNLQMSHLFI